MSRQPARVSLFVLLGVALCASDAVASHFRSATVRWRPDVVTVNGQPSVQPNVIVFTFDSVWRKSAFVGMPENPIVGVTRVSIGTFTFGDGGFAVMQATVTG